MILTIPTLEQLEGKNRLEQFKDGHIEAKTTDFAKILGVGTLMNGNHYDGYVINDYNTSRQVTNIYDENLKLSFSPNNRFMGIRVVVNFSDISKFCSNLKINRKGHIYQANCFLYPKNIVDKNTDKLDSLYNKYVIDNNHIDLKMANSIAVDSYPIDFEAPFYPKYQEQFIYDKKLYIRVLTNTFDKVVLSNNKTYDKNEFVWIESCPILWDIDQEKNIAMTHDIITGGIPFDVKRKYKGKLEKTTMYNYLNNYLKKDLIESIPYTVAGRPYKKTKFRI